MTDGYLPTLGMMLRRMVNKTVYLSDLLFAGWLGWRVTGIRSIYNNAFPGIAKPFPRLRLTDKVALSCWPRCDSWSARDSLSALLGLMKIHLSSLQFRKKIKSGRPNPQVWSPPATR